MAAPLKNQKPKEIKIANTTIEFGKTYTIDHKYDGTAPDGMKGLGATKLPLIGIHNSEKIYFDESRNAFDTGFYLQSVCNQSLINGDELVRLYNLYIKEPYEQRMNADCSETNFAFWDKFSYSVAVNKTFDTKDPVQLFELFHALKQGVVCNKDEGNSHLQKAQFNISNDEAIRTKEDTKFDNKIRAIDTFNLLLKSDTEKLYTILEYLGATDPQATDKDVLKRTYLRRLDDAKTGVDLVNRFLEASDKYNEKQGQLEMQYFAMCQKLYFKQIIVKKQGSFYDDKGTLLANSLKGIASKCLQPTEKELLENLTERYADAYPQT
jgi:hypothetical protein